MAGHSSCDSDSISTTSSSNSEETCSPLPTIGSGSAPPRKDQSQSVGLLDLFGVQLEVSNDDSGYIVIVLYVEMVFIQGISF